jgi:hypothetical protein
MVKHFQTHRHENPKIAKFSDVFEIILLNIMHSLIVLKLQRFRSC